MKFSDLDPVDLVFYQAVAFLLGAIAYSIARPRPPITAEPEPRASSASSPTSSAMPVSGEVRGSQ